MARAATRRRPRARRLTRFPFELLAYRKLVRDETVLRIDLVGLRVNGDRFMDQVCRAHGKLSGSR